MTALSFRRTTPTPSHPGGLFNGPFSRRLKFVKEEQLGHLADIGSIHKGETYHTLQLPGAWS